MKDHNDYFNSVTRCLMTFQYIEEALKMVLMRLEKLVYFRIKEFTFYNLKPKFTSIQNAAMGRLIDMLSVYCDDIDFIAELKRIKKQRDMVAHQSLLMTHKEIQDLKKIDIKSSDLEQLDKDASALLIKILEKWGDLDKTLNKITAEQKKSSNS